VSAAPVILDAPDPKVARIFELAAWLRRIGLCGVCAFDLAIVQTAKENAESHVPHRVCVRPSVPAGARREECERIARAKWREMPKP